MNSFLVMQGHTYKEEKDLGIIWSPKLDQGGNIPHSWLRMTEVKEGGRVFHYAKGYILAISVATSGCLEASKPSTMQNNDLWNDSGYLVELQYHELEEPLNIRADFDEISPLLPLKYSPFQQDSNGNKGYLYPCNEELSIRLLELISDLNIYQVDDVQLELSIGVVRRTERNTIVPLIAETEAEAKTKIRLGQQWKDCTNVERINSNNGVLLCCNHDALYDKGYIAFDGQGRLHVSSQIPAVNYEKYVIIPGTKIARSVENKPYFKWHKKNIYKN